VQRLVRPIPIVALGAVLALLALLAYGVSQKKTDNNVSEQFLAGHRHVAPNPTLPALDTGKPVSLASYRGQVVVLNFWASWCTPCRSEAPLLEKWEPELKATRATVVGVDVLDVTSDAKGFIKKFGLSYPQLRDADGSKLGGFSVTGYPETIVLDRSGKVAGHYRGPVTQQFFDAQVKPVLRERS
jgi:cytochrome c biogenesis protein CcmG/thiol:disulfide interchange protein DsbE